MGNIAYVDGQNLYMATAKRFASSLYKRVSRERYAYLDTPDMRALIGQKERPAS
mgnify:CR=1 FL=1